MSMNPVLVEVTRGDMVESRHRGAIAVVRADGQTMLTVGDTHRLVYPRSAIKPLQAIYAVESGAAEAFNLYEIDWTATAVTISVNGKVARRVAGTASVPQKPLFVRLHARSTEWNSMAEGAAFESYIAEFSFTPAQ